jgi:hypothetical protein
MEMLKKIEWKQIVVALAALGVISTNDPEAALISVAAMLMVVIINLVAKATDKPIGRGAVSIFVYVVAFGMAIFAYPPVTGYPVWGGDPAAYMEQLAALFAEFGPYALALTGSATVLYNGLSKLVFDRIEDHLLAKG